MPSDVAARSYTRLLDPNPASYVARLTVSPARRRALKLSIRRAVWYRFGVTPTRRLNDRWRCDALRPVRSTSSAMGTVRSACRSRYDRASSTASSVVVSGWSARGVHRRQARKPACSASSGDAKNATFLRSGSRDAHDGRQYTPVVLTA
jgi:hypothetical protein